jgi:hypothetical protein
MRTALRFIAAILLVTFASRAARADEIRLKDGSKIIGTIVGYEDDSFKVQTSYGFAMVRKDQILEIIPSPPKPQPAPPAPAPKPKESPSAAKGNDSAPATDAAPAAAAENMPTAAPNDSALSVAPDSHPPTAPDLQTDAPPSAPTVGPPVAAPPPAHAAPEKPAAHAASANHHVAEPAAPAAPSTAPRVSDAAAPPVAIATAAVPKPAPALPAPAAEAKPEPIHEEIVGNLYINHTFGFDLYKPPDWELLPDEMHSLPNAVAAMGADDDTTLLLIGREARKGALDAQAAATDTQLHDIYDNFRLISSAQTNIAGEPAIVRHFRGSAADRDWSVTVVTVAHGPNLFTLLGMTYADSDLIQIQENVIARAVASLRFETP